MSVYAGDERGAARLRIPVDDSDLALVTDRLDCCPHCMAPQSVSPSMWAVRRGNLVCGYRCPGCRRLWATRWALGTLAGAA